MNKQSAGKIIPQQEEGAKSDIVETINLDTAEEARAAFERAKEKLLDINNWQKNSVGISASFDLTNEIGEPINEAPAIGHHIRIDIPGPGNSAGEGYDWVRIELIEEESDPSSAFIALRVRPAHKPGHEKDTAHFFADDATSSFIISLRGTQVTAEVHGRNEKPNTTDSKGADKARNLIIGGGAVAGLAKIQWKKLVKGLLEIQ